MPREFNLQKEISLDATPDQVWAAISSPRSEPAFDPVELRCAGNMVARWPASWSRSPG